MCGAYILQASKDVLAMAALEVDLAKVEMGQTVTVKWRGKPVFVRRRTEAEIDGARAVDLGQLRDPERDEDRAKNPEVWPPLCSAGRGAFRLHHSQACPPVRHRAERVARVRNHVAQMLARAVSVCTGLTQCVLSQWLVVVGVCTHLGCVPLPNAGDYHGWFCPCHGSHYDTSGRVRKGPAPYNLEVPEYKFLDDSTLQVG